ncbi:MAG: metallophosphoesterase [Anaerolineales bacterium]
MANYESAQKKISRRDFLKLLKVGAIDLALLTAGGAGWSFFIEPNRVKVEYVNLTLPHLGPEFSGLRVVQISDIHMGSWMNAERLQHVADLAAEQKPDLLFLTGDFLVGHVFNKTSEDQLQDMVNILLPLAKSIPSFGILGNHDHWTKSGAVRAMLKDSDITELNNSVCTISRGKEHLHLCGVDDVLEGHARLDEVIEKLPGDSAAVLLAHEPDFADVSAKTGRFDLQISGHSHGGQVVIPFMGPPILPYLGQKYHTGLYQVGNMLQYTNRGVGMATPTVRFNCPPEVTVFTLKSA